MEINATKNHITNRRYLGSKTKLLEFINQAIVKEGIEFNSFLDLFAGTGCVANFFNSKNKKIIVNDILECNVVIYNTFFGKDTFDNNKIESKLKFYNNLANLKPNYFSKNFSNTYFSEYNCKKIGFIRQDIENSYQAGLLNKREKDILVSSLIFAMDRIANTVGHYDAYRRTGNLDRELVLKNFELPSNDVNFNNEIYKENANDLVKHIKADVVYIDPPYNSRQYCDAYHLLENVARWKKPQVFGVAKKMDRSNIKSKYCENSAPRVFDELIRDLNCKYIIVSYNNMGLKGAGRSQAKISDVDIIKSLELKGKVSIYETDFNQFTAGKTNVDNHKERLFICHVGKFEKPNNIEVNEFVKSPLNYTGGKFKLLKEILNRFPDGDYTFVDLFGGGFNVGANVKYKKVIYNDSLRPLCRLITLFYENNPLKIIEKLDELIQTYKLSDSQAQGYDFYESNSGNGLGAFNKQRYLKLRNDYNKSRESKDKDYLLLLLIIFGFNNQIRFNAKGEFNIPVGKRDLNSAMRKNIKLFSEKLKTKSIKIDCQNFKDFDYTKIHNPFLYCDPPYLLGEASYNENGGWTDDLDDLLMEYLKKADTLGIKFAMSNVIEHKGMTNQKLIDWVIKNRFNLIYLEKSYSNSNYHIKDKTKRTVEVLITNY